jgi:hypothetical protein
VTSRIAYSVIATLPDAQTADEYIAWLLDGHTAAVVRGGAESAMVVRIEHPLETVQVETRYLFPSRFGPERGIHMERRIGRIISATERSVRPPLNLP